MLHFFHKLIYYVIVSFSSFLFKQIQTNQNGQLTQFPLWIDEFACQIVFFWLCSTCKWVGQWVFCNNYIFIFFSLVSVSQALVFKKKTVRKCWKNTQKEWKLYKKNKMCLLMQVYLISGIKQKGVDCFSIASGQVYLAVVFILFLISYLTFIITNVPEKQGTLERNRSSTSWGHIQKS